MALDCATKEIVVLVDDKSRKPEPPLSQDFDSEVETIEIPGLTLPQPPLQTLGLIQNIYFEHVARDDRKESYRRVDEGGTNSHSCNDSSGTEMEVELDIPGLVLALSGPSSLHNIRNESDTRDISMKLPNNFHPNQVVDLRHHSPDRPRSVDECFTPAEANVQHKPSTRDTLVMNQPRNSSTISSTSSASLPPASSITAENPLKRLRDANTPLNKLSQPPPGVSAPNPIHPDRPPPTLVKPKRNTSSSSSDSDMSDSSSEPEYGSYTSSRTPSAPRDAFPRPSSSSVGVVGLPPTNPATKVFSGQSQKSSDDSDPDSDMELDTTSGEDLPVKRYPFDQPVKRLKTSHHTFSRTPSTLRDPFPRPSSVGLPRASLDTEAFLGQSQTMDTKKRSKDEDEDADMDTTSGEDLPIKVHPFDNPVKRLKTSHRSGTDRTRGGSITKREEDLRVDVKIKAERVEHEHLSTHLEDRKPRSSSLDHKGKGRETKTILGLSLPSLPHPLPMKNIPSSSCTIPQVRLGRARRVLVPGPRYKSDYPLATVSMKGDVQFVDRKTRKWHGGFSIPNDDNIPLNVEDACIVKDVIVLAYNSGPYQLGTIQIPPINPDSRRPKIIYANLPTGFRPIRSLAPIVSGSKKYAITTDSEKTVHLWDVDVSPDKEEEEEEEEEDIAGAKPAKIGVLPHIANALAVRGSELLYSRGKVLCIMNDIYRLPGRPITGEEGDSVLSKRELANEITHIHVPMSSGEKNLVIIETDHPRTQIGVYDTRKNIRVYGEDIAFGYAPGSSNSPPQQKTTRMETTRYFRGGPDIFGSPDTYKFVRGYSDGVVCLFDLRNAQAPVRVSARRDESSRSKAVFHATFGSFCVDSNSAPTQQSSASSSMKRISRSSSRTSSQSSSVKGKHMVKGIVTFGGKELDFLDLELNAY